MRLLLERGALKDARANEGMTPLHQATKDGHLEAVKALVAAGADVSVREAQGKTALQLSEALSNAQLTQVLRDATRATQPAATAETLAAMGVGEVKSFLGGRGLNFAGCCEKSELLALALGTLGGAAEAARKACAVCGVGRQTEEVHALPGDILLLAHRDTLRRRGRHSGRDGEGDTVGETVRETRWRDGEGDTVVETARETQWERR
jgi:hypothetical protein